MKHIRLFAFLLVTVLSMIGDSNAQVLKKDAELYEQVMPVAIAVRDAVINRQISVLIKYSNPDPLYGYAEFLDDMNSEEYKYLYDDAWNRSSKPSRKSVYQVLKKSRKPAIILWLNGTGSEKIITAYYYDAAVLKLKLPLSMRTARLWGKEFVTCRFVNTPEGWKVAYSIFDYGTDYILDR